MDTKIPFGKKFNGYTLNQVYEMDDGEDYIKWMRALPNPKGDMKDFVDALPSPVKASRKRKRIVAPTIDNFVEITKAYAALRYSHHPPVLREEFGITDNINIDAKRCLVRLERRLSEVQKSECQELQRIALSQCGGMEDGISQYQETLNNIDELAKEGSFDSCISV